MDFFFDALLVFLLMVVSHIVEEFSEEDVNNCADKDDCCNEVETVLLLSAISKGGADIRLAFRGFQFFVTY